MLGFAPTLIWLFAARILERHRHRQHRRRAGLHRRRDAARATRARDGDRRHRFRPRLHLRAVHRRRAVALPCRSAAKGCCRRSSRPGLSTVNLLMALRTLPESLPPERRGRSVRRASPIDLGAFRAAVAVPGIGAAVAINFIMMLWFSGMEQTFRLFTADGFGMSDAGDRPRVRSRRDRERVRARGAGRAPGPAVRRGAPGARRARRSGGGVRAARPIAAVRRRRARRRCWSPRR